MTKNSIHRIEGSIEQAEGGSPDSPMPVANRSVDVLTDPQTAELVITVEGPDGKEVVEAGYHERLCHGEFALLVSAVVPGQLVDRERVFDGLAEGIEQIEKITGVPKAEVPLVDPSVDDVAALQERGFEIPPGEVLEVEVSRNGKATTSDTLRITTKQPIREPLPEALDLDGVELKPGQEVSLRRVRP